MSTMSRPARLDAFGTLHHVMVRGIELTAILRDDPDRVEFVVHDADMGEQGADP
jgi:hypothetical protein